MNKYTIGERVFTIKGVMAEVTEVYPSLHGTIYEVSVLDSYGQGRAYIREENLASYQRAKRDFLPRGVK